MNIILNAKMKTICVNFFMLKFTFSVLSVQIVTFVKADETRYTTMYDNINYEQIMKNDRLLRFYVNCLLDKGPCTAEGRELKRILPEALEKDCSKCSDKQKKAARRVISFLKSNEPQFWSELANKYDPDGKYKEKYITEWLFS